MAQINSGDTAWILTRSALVLMMTIPGLFLFYGGLVRSKNVLGTIMQSFIVVGLISIMWVLWGYTLAFGPDVGGLIGNLDWLALNGVGAAPNPDLAAGIPHLAFMVFQMMFAIITPALITGASPSGRSSARSSCSCSCGALSSTRRWRTGYGAAAGWGRWAPSTLPAAPWSISAPAFPRWQPPWSMAHGVDTAGKT